MGVSVASVNSRSQRLLAKLGAANRKDAARLAAEYRLI
jgi:DNA-binding NarL/FixJ family response regulator